jgi:uncharacterized protein YecE (DUF72 family)
VTPRRNFLIGCSGFSYGDWRGVFYPVHLDPSAYLSFYEKYFDVVEINFTFYKMPERRQFEAFLEKSKRIRFSVKANSLFTHQREFTDQQVKLFKEAVSPLIEADRFIGLLFQFPQSFHLSDSSLSYLRELSEKFSDLPRIAELRSRSFLRREVLMEIELMGFSVANVDAPKLKGLLVGPWEKSGEINYVRLHGRNAENWHKGEKSYERYDYLYSEDELKELRDKLLRVFGKETTYVFFNNHYRAKAVLNALRMKELFGEEVKIPSSLKGLRTSSLWE